MLKKRIIALVVLALGVLIAFATFSSNQTKPFRLGLDLSGGVLLTYDADISNVPAAEIDGRLDSLRDVIERRVNSDVSGALGVLEPTIRVEKGGFLRDENTARLLVELPGVTDVEQATGVIGETPLLEFRLLNPEFDITLAPEGGPYVNVVTDEITGEVKIIEPFITTELTGQYLKSARVDFSQGGNGGLGGEPIVALTFTKEGGDIFEKITSENIGNVLAIFLDRSPISQPVIRDAISGGEAIVSGDFTLDGAKDLASRLSLGALPVEISLVATQEIGPTLGKSTTEAGVRAAIIGFLIVALFFILWYRLPGVIAVISLGIYGAVMLGLFKVIPVTITAAGIAGFVLSVGIAVDANVLIFERLKEEMKNKDKDMVTAMKDGFARAWISIRDSNASSIISAFILFITAPSLIRGFALTFGLGVLVSMISAITVSRILLMAITNKDTRFTRTVFSSGFKK